MSNTSPTRILSSGQPSASTSSEDRSQFRKGRSLPSPGKGSALVAVTGALDCAPQLLADSRRVLGRWMVSEPLRMMIQPLSRGLGGKATTPGHSECHFPLDSPPPSAILKSDLSACGG